MISEDLHLFNCWQFGDWKSLAHIDTQKDAEKQLALKACAQLQLGEHQLAKKNLEAIPHPVTERTKRLLISGLFNTLGKARSLVDDTYKAESHFVKSLQLASYEFATSKVYKARIDEQLTQLGIKSQNFLVTENNQKPTSFKLPETAEKHFTKNLTVSFWIKLRSWPNRWTNIVSKAKNDTNNEFCLRLKNEDAAQFYCGIIDKAVILNNWHPKKHIRLNEWTHVAAVKKMGKSTSLYIDGLTCSIRDIQGMSAANENNEPIELLGQEETAAYLDAEIRGFSIYNDAQTTKQIIKSMQLDLGIELCSDVQLEYCGINKKISALEKIEFVQAQKHKHKVASGLCGLNYYSLIDEIKNKIGNRKVKLVVIGANDGKTNDPLYDYMVKNSSQTQVLLIEPQEALIPYLKENYAFHSDAHIVKYAIGDTGYLTLYAVKPEYWSQLNVPYAEDRNWPIYRAPTGITSSNSQHVTAWLEKHLEIDQVSDAIVQINVPCKTLYKLMQECGFGQTLDVLQIDTEGFDDYVIYQCDLKIIKPKIIHFENAHLSKNRKKDLYDYLRINNYQVFEIEGDSLALLGFQS